MSRRLPVISGQQMVKALKRAGFEVLRQRGSHVSMEKREPQITRKTVVPQHREIRPGTLNDILKQTGLSKDDLRKLIK
jgi:predicted RNA binding protein YcfA (HicA-like mRNA interferase family)